MLKITFEFVGGPHDGKLVEGVLGQPSDAERYYLFTNHGRIGQRLKVASEYAIETLASEQLKVDTRHNFQRHYYVVTERLEDAEAVYVRAQYLRQTAKAGQEQGQ